MELFAGLRVKGSAKIVKKPCNHRKLTEAELTVLEFVSLRCSTTCFPAKRTDWDSFQLRFMGSGMQLPTLRDWNSIRKIRLYDVFNKEPMPSQKWWLDTRKRHNLLTSCDPSPLSVSSACLTLFICPKDVSVVVTFLRCNEVFWALQKGQPVDYTKGAHHYMQCNRHSIPICFKKQANPVVKIQREETANTKPNQTDCKNKNDKGNAGASQDS